MYNLPTSKVKAWLTKLPQYRIEFRALGFQIPDMELQYIEGARERTILERDYSFYLDEKCKEHFGLGGKTWTLGKRHLTSLPSAYLTTLVEIVTRESLLRQDQYTHKTGFIDPNLLWAARVAIKTPDRVLARLSEIAEQRRREVEYFHERIERYLPKSKAVSAKSAIPVFNAIAQDCGLELVCTHTGKNPYAVWKASHPGGLPFFLMWDDSYVLNKWGSLQITYSVFEIPSMPRILEEPILRFVSSSIVPGARHYERELDDWPLKILGFMVNAELARIISRPL